MLFLLSLWQKCPWMLFLGCIPALEQALSHPLKSWTSSVRCHASPRAFNPLPLVLSWCCSHSLVPPTTQATVVNRDSCACYGWGHQGAGLSIQLQVDVHVPTAEHHRRTYNLAAVLSYNINSFYLKPTNTISHSSDSDLASSRGDQHMRRAQTFGKSLENLSDTACAATRAWRWYPEPSTLLSPGMCSSLSSLWKLIFKDFFLFSLS